MDLWEINEAFAMVTMAAIDAFELDPAKVNINGGACALGSSTGLFRFSYHCDPDSCLETYWRQKGIAALCIGGGEATAIAVELI